jgi:hypothetical protein
MILAFALPSSVPRAGAAEDAEGPSLALPTDRARSHARIALVADPAAALFGGYGPRAGFAIGTHQAVWVFPSFQQRFGRRGAALELAYAVMPLGKALEGLRFATFVSAARFPGGEPIRLFRVGGEAGYAHVWGRLLVGASAGVARSFARPAEIVGARRWELVARAELGWVFL